MKSNGFVPTGTKAKDRTIGPEAGMVERLNALYPDREFWVVKCATGGEGLLETPYIRV